MSRAPWTSMSRIDVLPRREARQHLGLRRAVEVAVDLVVLEELGVPRHPLELGSAHEVILAAVRLALAPGLASCARPRSAAAVRRAGCASSRRMSVVLPAAGGRGHDEEEPRGGVAHSMFWTCSRIFSVSAFMSRISRVEARSRLFEPSVFSSRRISCVRKSSVLPTDPVPLPQDSVELVEVSLEPLELLGDVGAVGRERRLLFEPARVDRPRRERGRARARGASRRGCARSPRAAPPGLGRLPPQERDPRREIGGDRRALGRPHRHERGGGLVGERLDAPRSPRSGRSSVAVSTTTDLRNRQEVAHREPALDRVTARRGP